ncbi:DegV family protein [Mollicutes bacterium LVI A0039]|nr:DegV family protein [Mollicutes bacterium LVI A0039]
MNTGLIMMSTASMTDTIRSSSDCISQVIELQVVINDEAIDSSKVSLETLFKTVAETGKIPQTSQPTPYAFEQALTTGLEKFDNLVVITPHSEISGTYQNCLNVVNEHPHSERIFVLQVNGGIAITETMVIEYAIEQINNNIPFAQLKANLEEFNNRLVIYTFPGDFSYLKVSGRVNGAAALLLNALNIRVVVKMEAGTPIIDHKGRGDKSVLKYIDNLLKSANIEKAYYTSIADNPDLRKMVIQLLESNNIDYTITDEANSVPAAHLGPNNFGIAILSK